MPNEASVAKLKGVGIKKAELLAKLNIRTLPDLLYSYPRSYEDRRNRVTVSALAAGTPAVFRARVRSVALPQYSVRGRRVPFRVLVGDDTAAVEIVFFQSKYIDKIFTIGREFLFYGTPQHGMGKLQLVHPNFEAITDGTETEARPIVPIYPLTAGLSQNDLRRWHDAALSFADEMPEVLPARVLANAKLCDLAYALKNIHFPESREALSAAKYRLIFEELLVLQIGLTLMRSAVTEKKSVRSSERPAPGEFEKLLPFSMTGAQRRVTTEIYRDMASEKPMRRLVQGDVGSGKTAVAAAAIYKAVKNGAQAAMMAPTEILARQHYEDLSHLFDGLFRVALLSSSVKAAERKEILEGLANGDIALAVGTHALLRPEVRFARLGLAVTDEQHRFGVNQRISLSEKGGAPDVLVMSATPIPRTLAFILYGDLDISVIDELPPGRKPVVTTRRGSAQRAQVYDFVGAEIEKGRQVYVVAPLIEEMDERGAGEEDMEASFGSSHDLPVLRSAEGLYEELSARFKCRVALLHGAMKSAEKERTMTDFAEGRISILVSTVVIEVGVNVKNASLMVIENAERFGLAQLHQLRGRVGRGAEQSYCILITDSDTDEAQARAQIMTETADGFVIAEKDLEMRGPGELFGVRQHGVPELRLADLVRHGKILQLARDEAKHLTTEDPQIEQPENEVFRAYVEAQFKTVSEIGL